ncbi:DivIVA domain-containing protein [Luteipulveratus sp. YIM 133132]|uniref:DivIVA domain-containing protein n=1 Tax=Luteipulveratus flavus TaxID=3031728 RepID=A0ABT6C7S6_9MICO|nr:MULTISPECIES: DivIVA domain-containing protein [unclassified Luteipulveratus]MDE9365801.1 DivIVA domain-containing protein [Luteipulveratus sp. YIM 133132]MDF8264991.1 DivIVA domain-containing protein [Luteipulveratus sp. YIM 133296]
MIVVLIALLVVVIGLAAAVVIGRIPVTTMDDPTATSAFEPLPEGRVTEDDLDALRLDQTLRGYRMSQVDGVLDRLRDELLSRDREIERLRAELAGRPVGSASTD